VWTHTFWDSFTHYDGWMVLHLPFLRSLCRYLQYLSTVVGAAALVLAYLSWLRRQHRLEPATRADLVRYIAAMVARRR
jgi:coproporphyrinogen III oxidase-like Fe-S oxidoreductase